MILNLLQAEKNPRKRIMRRLLLQLAYGDLCWSITNTIYNALQMLLGNLGYCAYWVCVIERTWSQFWSGIIILAIVLISLYIFLCLNFPEVDYTRVFNALFILSYYLAAGSIMLSLGQGDWIVNRFGWCQPKPKNQVFDFLPIPLFFVIICFFYGITLIKYWWSQENSEAGVSEKSSLSIRLGGYVVAFFLIWGINTFYSLWVYLYGFYSPPFALTMAKVISLESSGFLNFVVYGFFNKQLRTRYTLFWGFVTFLFSPCYLIVALFKQYCCRSVSPHEVIDPPTPNVSAFSQTFSPSHQRMINFSSGDDTYNSFSSANSGHSKSNNPQDLEV